MSLSPMSHHLLAWSFGETGNALRSAGDGSICCAPKRFCSPLVRLSISWQRALNPPIRKPEHSGPIGGSIGTNVSLVMPALLLHHHLRLLSMASRSGLPKHLALMC